MNSNIYRNKKSIIFFLVPAFAILSVFLYYPFIQNIINSFKEMNHLGAVPGGWNDPWYTNYIELMRDGNVKVALINTLKIIIMTLLGQLVIAICLALLADNVKRGQNVFGAVYFFPIVISATALGLLFNLIFLYDKGMLNQFLQILGVEKLIDFKDVRHAMLTMMIPITWQYVGFYFIILTTGLRNISTELYEAALIDGADKLQRVRYISLPLLHNVICTCCVLAVTGALKVFDLPWVMFPKGMPGNSTWLTGTYMYYHAFESHNVDYSSTLSVLIVLLGVLAAKVVNIIFREKDY
ncbi:carbohydrate ABC transporter permease [Kineothrix sp. MB12-C1]|uniref:carbohydrate ABC transporter permease n=1 Tax=Kineothrix sp. MB12-C1 TaxID=3070215 RepID=UPI0027D26031|nr:sugar ABC transporter permease [Kineothrix sp. MB12-C1]WMC91862.1 sugar ABC transporter permease [Kineothrix sp. MB12-C1]